MISLDGLRIFLDQVTLFIISVIVFMGVGAFLGNTGITYIDQQATPESLVALREEFDLYAPIHFDCGSVH